MKEGGSERPIRILVINPGSTSTRLALFENERGVWTEILSYSLPQLAVYSTVHAQLELRSRDIDRLLDRKGVDIRSLDAVSARGGPSKPLAGGTYRIGPAVLDDVREGRVVAEHASNLGVLLANGIASRCGIPAFFVDPVSVDEFEPVARISGLPEIERKSLLHALNIKATARILARTLGRDFETMNLVAAHLGGGISVCAVRGGRIVDVNNANEGGPFSPERAGSLPVGALAQLCFSGKYTHADMKRKLVGQAGLSAHLGTHDAREVEKAIRAGDARARLVYEAMAYQIAKEIGAMAAVLCGSVDAVLLTGGLAHSEMLVGWIRERIGFCGPVHVVPGEHEMEALALGALRVIRGEENAKEYPPGGHGA